MALVRLPFWLVFTLCAFLIGSSLPVRAQEDKAEQEAMTKRKTLDLLDKAKEEYRIYFKRPETTIEFWSAIKFEMDLGKFDLAAWHLKLMLAKEPPEQVDKDLVHLEQAEGMSAFLRLKLVRQWSDHPPFQKEAVANVDTLIDRVTRAVEKHLSDPDRIKKYMKRLIAPTEEERAFAYVQIARSRERAVPYLVEGLRVEYGKELFPRLREVMLRIDPETVPVYLEVFKAANDKDFRDLELRLTLLDIIQRRDDKRVLPYLWHLSSAKQYPPAVRQRAKEVQASLLRVQVPDLPPARESLTFLAEQYYQHKVPFAAGRPILLWPWNGESIALKPVELSPSQAEEYFGLRYARQALDLDPAYQPAQVVLLNLTMERQYRDRVDQILLEPIPPKMHHLLTTIDADLLLRVLERAMEDRQIPIILPLLQVLGERGEYRAIRLNTGGQPRGVARGLYDPDRRVQFASMKAMLRMPAGSTPLAADRIVDLARRFLGSDATPRALVVHAPAGQEVPIRQTVKDLGYQPDLARQVKDAVDKGKTSADHDLVILHHGLSEQEFPFVYAQLQKDVHVGGLPMLVIVSKQREKLVKKFAARDPNVLVLSDDRLQAGEELKDLLDRHIKKVQFSKLTPQERKEFSRVSMDTLWRMARGEIPGYDVTPALDVITAQLGTPDNAVLALEILGRLPGKEIQYRLAGVVSDPARDKKLRLPAVMELNRHIQKNGLQLDKNQLIELKNAFRQAAEDPALLKELTVTVSMIDRSTARRTGAQLFEFRPDPPGQPPMPKEKKEEEKKDNP